MKFATLALAVTLAAPAIAQTPGRPVAGATEPPKIEIPYTQFTLPGGLLRCGRIVHSVVPRTAR